jgi:hypothetical protein
MNQLSISAFLSKKSAKGKDVADAEVSEHDYGEPCLQDHIMFL